MFRDVFEDEAVRVVVDEACERWARADDVWQAVTWAVARDPTVGVQLSESGNARSLTLDGARSIDAPTVTIVYTFDEHSVTIHRARFENARAMNAGRA